MSIPAQLRREFPQVGHIPHGSFIRQRLQELGQRLGIGTERIGMSQTWSVALKDGPMIVQCLTPDPALAARIRRAVGGTAFDPQDTPAAELRIFQRPRRNAPSAVRSGHLVLPLNLDFFVPTRPGPNIPREWSLARLRRAGIELVVRRDSQSVAAFYRDLYLPTLARRNPEGRPSPLRDAIKNAQRGWLMLMQHEGRLVAGGLMCPSPVCADESWFSHMGYSANAPAFIRASPYVAAFELSRRFDFAATDLLAALPILSDGLAQYKLSWGSQVRVYSESRTRVSGASLCLAFSSTPALIRFCRQHPVLALTQGLPVLIAGRGFPSHLPDGLTRVDADAIDPAWALERLAAALYERSSELSTHVAH